LPGRENQSKNFYESLLKQLPVTWTSVPKQVLRSKESGEKSIYLQKKIGIFGRGIKLIILKAHPT